MTETKDKILDTAERLIGERGYAATSLRQIIAEAGVNLAAVHYHFGSKEDLLDAVVARKVTPVNEARIASPGTRGGGGGPWTSAEVEKSSGVLSPADSGQWPAGIRDLCA